MRQQYYLRLRHGIYHVLFTDQLTSKQIDRTTGTSDEKRANAIAQEWIVNGLPEKPRTSTIAKTTTFCDYLVQFWDFEKSMYFRELETMGRDPQPEHVFEMQKLVERYYRSFFKTTLLCQVDGESLQEFIVHLKIERGLSSNTVNLARNAAFVALKYAKRKKMIKYFDFDAVLRAGGKPKERGVLEKHEVEKLFKVKWSSIRSRIAVLIALHTGMRLGEIRALRVCDIHENKIKVNHSWSKKNRLKCTKNKEMREIPIIPYLHNEIMAYIKQMQLFKLDSLLLPGKNPEKPLDSVQIREDYYKVLNEIGIDEKTRKERGIVFHSWRHLLAKNIVEKGGNKAIGMKILGHKTSRIFDHYASITDKKTFDHMIKVIEMVTQDETPKEPIPFKVVV